MIGWVLAVLIAAWWVWSGWRRRRNEDRTDEDRARRVAVHFTPEQHAEGLRAAHEGARLTKGSGVRPTTPRPASPVPTKPQRAGTLGGRARRRLKERGR